MRKAGVAPKVAPVRLRRSPKRAKQCATEEAEDRARNEEDGPEGKERDVAERRPQAEIVRSRSRSAPDRGDRD